MDRTKLVIKVANKRLLGPKLIKIRNYDIYFEDDIINQIAKAVSLKTIDANQVNIIFVDIIPRKMEKNS